MTGAADAIELLDRLDAAGIWWVLEGGWGVDALLGVETREHDERQLVQLANAAWAAGLSLLAAGDREGAAEWLRRPAARNVRRVVRLPVAGHRLSVVSG